jgi:hypothetical protein
MNYAKVKKNVYYDPPDEYPHSSRNHAEDFADCIVPLGDLHHGTVHDRGIAAGLEVSGALNAVEVAISAGVAVDGAGRMIVLSTTGHGDIGDNPALGNNNEVGLPVHLPLGTQANKTVYVTIQYSEILRPAEGSGGRLEQVPWLRLQPVSGVGAYVDDGSSVILAIVVINAAGALTQLKSEDGAIAFRRRSLGQSLDELRVRRPLKTGNQLAETVAARLNSGPSGGLQIGVSNAGDSIVLGKDDGNQCARVETHAGVVVCKDAAGREVVRVDANSALLRVGAQGNDGDFTVQDAKGNAALLFTSSNANLNIGTTQNEGNVVVRDASNNVGVRLDGDLSRVSTSNLNPIGDRNAIDVNARFFRIHGWDLVLDGRSGGNARALVDAGGKLILNFANDYPNGVQLGGVLRDPAGRALMGNPARKVDARFMFSSNGGFTTETVNFPGGPTQFFAYGALVLVNATTDFDYDNCVYMDIFMRDGAPTGSQITQGNLGPPGDVRNMHSSIATGVASSITFRVASLGPDVQAVGIGVVFFE